MHAWRIEHASAEATVAMPGTGQDPVSLNAQLHPVIPDSFWVLRVVHFISDDDIVVITALLDRVVVGGGGNDQDQL
jgi:hypothetical protein